MTLPSNNPDATERFKWSYNRACAAYAAGGSVHVFRASLFALGYRGQEIESELNYQNYLMDKTLGEALVGFGNFASGLPK